MITSPLHSLSPHNHWDEKVDALRRSRFDHSRLHFGHCHFTYLLLVLLRMLVERTLEPESYERQQSDHYDCQPILQSEHLSRFSTLHFRIHPIDMDQIQHECNAYRFFLQIPMRSLFRISPCVMCFLRILIELISMIGVLSVAPLLRPFSFYCLF
jgi:hypothetical protein